LKLAVLAPLLFVACRQVAGISTITYSGGDGGGGGACTNSTMVLTSSSQLDALFVGGGFVTVAQISVATLEDSNIFACATGTPCTEPPGLVNLSFNDKLESYTTTSQILYSLQTSATGAGAIHSLSFDGKTDTVLLGTATYPLWIAASGTKTFWVSDDQTAVSASLHCIGCSGPGDTTWITNLTQTFGVLADANNVYVVTDDGSANATDGIYSCSVQAACAGTPKTVITGLGITATNINSQVVSDGTNLYVTNDTSAVVRIGPTGTQTNVVKGVAAAAIAVDPATGDLFYGTDTGDVASVKADGSTTTPTALSKCDPQDANAILGIAYDATNVYVLVQPVAGNDSVYAIKR
jgi:hypothetical protein